MGTPRVVNVAVGPDDLVEGNRRRRGLSRRYRRPVAALALPAHSRGGIQGRLRERDGGGFAQVRGRESSGPGAESDVALDTLKEKYAAVSAYNIAEMHAYRGEIESAFEWLERAYRQHDGGMIFLRIDPMLSPLRGDSRYKVLLAKMKLAD
jgi:hypothetical protein